MDALHAATRARTCWALSIVAGLAFALWLWPAAALDPRQWQWLLEGDRAQHFLGWQFFRNEAWQWPPGRLWAYGEAMGSSIVFTDSIPLLALMLKPFSAMLPQPLQYAGPWIVACYALTGAFAWRCGWLATGRAEAGLLLALFAVLSPMIALRGLAHFALAAQWIIWWSLALYLEPGPRIAWWRRGLCLAIASLVHAYLLFIALAVFAAEWMRRVWVLRQVPPRTAALVGIGIALVLAAVMALAGYFVVPDPGSGDRRYGLYGADLDAWWASLDGARFGPYRPPSLSRGLEGMHYLGAGVWLLLGIAAAAALRRPAQVAAGLRTHTPLILAALVLAMLAFTHQLGFGGRTVAEWPLDEQWLAILSLFRGSGRMLWLADILLVLVAVVAVFRALLPVPAVALVGVLWLVQLADLAAPLSALRANIAADVARPRHGDLQQPLVSPFWAEAGPRYRRLAVAPMRHAAPGWISFGLLAFTQGWSINTGQFARAPWQVWRGEHEWMNASLGAGLLDPDTLYVLQQPSLLNLDALPPDVGLGRVDGSWVIAPGWFPRGGCCLATIADAGVIAGGFSRSGVPAAMPIRIDSATVTRSMGMWDDGWGAPSAALAFDADRAGRLRLAFDVPPAIATAQRLSIHIDGSRVTARADAAGRIAIALPLSRTGSHLLRIESQEGWVPSESGHGADKRTLAWRLIDAGVVE
jgi:hypothetical protein